jgi:hypothetical protein
MKKFELYYPLKHYFVTQYFGGNAQYYQNNGINIIGHNGIDILANHGAPVYASHDGYLDYGSDLDGGHGVTITTDNTYEYKGKQVYFKTVYWHFCDPKKEPQFKSPFNNMNGVFVKAGTLIGYADSTGLSTGDHCHWALKPMMKNSAGVLYNVEQNNGYLGAVDQTPYLNNKSAADIQGKYLFTKDIHYGDRGEDVRQLQIKLIYLGYKIPSTATGYFGKETRSALIKFQDDQKIPLTFSQRNIALSSIAGPATRAALNKL